MSGVHLLLSIYNCNNVIYLIMCSVSEARVFRRNDLVKRNISGTESNNRINFESEIRKHAHAIIIELEAGHRRPRESLCKLC